MLYFFLCKLFVLESLEIPAVGMITGHFGQYLNAVVFIRGDTEQIVQQSSINVAEKCVTAIKPPR